MRDMFLFRLAHKLICGLDDPGRRIFDLIQRAICHSLIEYSLMICVASLFDLDPALSPAQRQELASAGPLFARVELGIEPSHILNLFHLVRDPEKWDCSGIEGMLQILDITTLCPSNKSSTTAKPSAAQVDDWSKARTRMRNHGGDVDTPLTVLEFWFTGTPIMTYVLPIVPAAIKIAKARLPFAPCNHCVWTH